MPLPFTQREFLDLFVRYNETVWPLQWLLNALALIVLVLAMRRTTGAARAAMVVLAALWLWAGAVYDIGFFSKINPAAMLFGAVFLVEAALLAWSGFRRRGPAFSARDGLAAAAGWAMIVYALVAYPVLGYLLGHRYPASPTFGLPCPTTIFTFGVLLWLEPAPPWWLLVVPLLWALVGTSAALQLGMREDLGLAVSAIIVIYVLLRLRRSHSLAGALRP
jgi:hypothetical protein